MMKEVKLCYKTLEETKSKIIVWDKDLQSSMAREELNELDTPINELNTPIKNTEVTTQILHWPTKFKKFNYFKYS